MNSSPFSDYKLNKAVTSQGYPQAASSPQDSLKLKGTASNLSFSNQGTNRFDVKEGQIIKGEIIDLHFEEVKVRLEPGNQTITAKLSSNLPLSIGQEARFQVTEGSASQITLKYLPADNTSQTNPTVKIALEASGLPATDRNKALVSELLDNQMSIDKQTLQMLVRISNMNREASPATLVLMYKNNLPITSANIAQFEAYQNGTHQLLNDIHTITDNISELFKSFSILNQFGETDAASLQLTGMYEQLNTNSGSNVSIKEGLSPDGQINTEVSEKQQADTGEVLHNPLIQGDVSGQLSDTASALSDNPAINAMYGETVKELLDISTDKTSAEQQKVTSDKILNLNNELLSILKQEAGSNQEVTSLDTPIGRLLNNNELILLKNELSKTASENISDLNNLQSSLKQIGDGTMSLKEAMQLITKLYGSKPAADQNDLQAKVPVLLPPDNPAAPVVSRLAESFLLTAESHRELGNLLTPEENTRLLELMKQLPDSDNIKEGISAGTAKATNVLEFINKQLLSLNTSDAVKLLESSEYSKILEEAFHQKWTLTPDKLARKSSLDNLYQDLQKDLEKLASLSDLSRKPAENLRFMEPVKNLQNNLQFMKDLNGILSYVQLPIQLKKQDVHGDLYVFTKKNALRNKKDTLSVLLHLDMANLGPLNIHMAMEQLMLQATFYPSDVKSGDILSVHLPELIHALSNKGYNLQARIESASEKIDFVKDILGNNTPENPAQRYSFDIRA